MVGRQIALQPTPLAATKPSQYRETPNHSPSLFNGDHLEAMQGSEPGNAGDVSCNPGDCWQKGFLGREVLF